MKVYTSNIFLTMRKRLIIQAKLAFHLEDTYHEYTLCPANYAFRFVDTYHYPGKLRFYFRGYLPHFTMII